MNSFTADIDRFLEHARSSRNTVVQKVCFELSRAVVLKTPVDTGRARANWQSTLGSPAVGEVDSTSGADAVAGALTASENAPGTVFYLVNNLDYISALEYGHSVRQAPGGMVRVTVAEFQAFFRQAVREERL